MELAAKLFGVSRFTAVVILVTGLLLITGCADFTLSNNSPQNNSARVAYNERTRLLLPIRLLRLL